MNTKFEQLTLEDLGLIENNPEKSQPNKNNEADAGNIAGTSKGSDAACEGDTSSTETESCCDCRACKHDVVFKALKRSYVTYCRSCGKILTVQNKTKRK